MLPKYHDLVKEDKIIEGLKKFGIGDPCDVNYRFNLRVMARFIIEESKNWYPYQEIKYEWKYEKSIVTTLTTRNGDNLFKGLLTGMGVSA